MKTCSKCKIAKPLSAYARNKCRADGYQCYCKDCFKTIKKNQYQKHKKVFRNQCRKARLRNRQFIHDYLKTHTCVCCSETDPIVLTFDHVRGKKRFNLARARAHSYAIKTIAKEIAKCQVLCCNCHARKTAKQFNWYQGLK